VALFAVYRRLQARGKDYRIAETERLRQLHRDGKLALSRCPAGPGAFSYPCG
jgi:hypothetical protein